MSVMRRFLSWLVGHLSQPRIIYDRAGVSKYLSRWYLVNRPKMPDGGDPFDSTGSLRTGLINADPGFGLFLHRFHRSDDDHHPHSHPWRWAVSLVLAGGYVEQRLVDGELVERAVRPWSLNFIRDTTYHRVDLLEKDCWSLFLAGPKAGSWGFMTETGHVPWREYIARRRGTDKVANRP
jgi:hypothetical protein